MADETKSGTSPAIIVAIISGVVAIATTVITQWDKLFPHAAPATVATSTATTSATTAAAASGAAAAPPPVTGIAPPAPASEPPPETPSGAAGPVSIAGIWYTDEGDEFTFTQTGGRFTYKHAHNGSPASTGEGTLRGTRATYTYASRTGAGTCDAAFAELGQALVGRCTEGGASWPVRIHR